MTLRCRQQKQNQKAKWNYINKKLLSSKGNNKVKRQLTEWENTHANHISIYK